MQTKKFVGPKAVANVVIDSLKTFGGQEVVMVHYENGEQELMPKRTFELVSSEEATDYTKVRTKKFEALRKDVYPIIATAVAVVGESDEVKQKVRKEMLEKVLAAISEIDMKDSEQQPFFDQVLVECNSIINAILYELSASMARAINFLWTKDDTRFVPGANPMDDRTYLEAKKIVADVSSNTTKTAN